MTSLTPCLLSMRADHALLMERREKFLHAAVALVRSIVPETTQFWCYGINALRPLKPGRDWDFIAFVADSTSDERMELLNDLNGPLADLRAIGEHTMDVVVMRAGCNTPCARLVRSEGFCVWRKPLSLSGSMLREA
ncbi:hypothetical protein [Stutzerimonas stutzeri]|uniref:hypothetical protein n=1 Tax=Stutzerimonas stutzeri TaxID=316 RepID=UPI00265D20E1|nr:hypothetical protein [Stutzerimonas stutzeri]MCF6783729.1 hypothetical protein [Stutzerimonas stutzeri]